MKQRFMFPGSFCPPTYGHAAVVKNVAAYLPELTIICSRNPKKEYWFSADECAEMWESYDLPANVSVTTYEKLKLEVARGTLETKDIVMVRGIRDEKDFLMEAEAMKTNLEGMGITNYLYTITGPEYREISSSGARAAADKVDIAMLAKYVSPMVVSRMLEKVLGADNVFMVVGKPGSGKSTFLNELCLVDKQVVAINTDEINHQLQPLLQNQLPGVDLLKLAAESPEIVNEKVGQAWLACVGTALKVKGFDCKNIFVEVPYGMCEDKKIYRYLGKKVIYFDCPKSVLGERNEKRGTPQYKPFIDIIPGLEESRQIARREKLQLDVISSDGELRNLPQSVADFRKLLADRVGHWEL